MLQSRYLKFGEMNLISSEDESHKKWLYNSQSIEEVVTSNILLSDLIRQTNYNFTDSIVPVSIVSPKKLLYYNLFANPIKIIALWTLSTSSKASCNWKAPAIPFFFFLVLMIILVFILQNCEVLAPIYMKSHKNKRC